MFPVVSEDDGIHAVNPMSDTLPTLAFSNPLCPVCLQETDRDTYAYSCDDCGIQWDDNGQDPDWMYAGGQCRSIITREHGGLTPGTDTYRCMRSVNHPGASHRNTGYSRLAAWMNGQPGVSEVAE